MALTEFSLSLVIVTYNRNQVLVDTIGYLLEQARSCKAFQELLIIDQTEQHDEATDKALSEWDETGRIRWIHLTEPNLTGAMNRGLLEAKGNIVLYTDDDIIPGKDLLNNHIKAYQGHLDLAAVVGQILQPGEEPEELVYTPKGSQLRRYMDFPFRSTLGCYVENAMAGNLSVVKSKAIEVGGFDENFKPPVASRFESEFAKRLVRAGGKIWFEPSASIYHLAVKSGGTRTKGSFLASASPIYGVGDFYFTLLVGEGFERWSHVFIRPFRQVRTKFHLRHPWWIVPKFIGEVRALLCALTLKRSGQRLLNVEETTEK